MAEDIKRSDLLLSLIKLEKDKGFVSLVDVIAAKKAYKEGKSYTNDEIMEALKEFDVHYTESEDGSDFDEEEPTEEELEGKVSLEDPLSLDDDEFDDFDDDEPTADDEEDANPGTGVALAVVPALVAAAAVVVSKKRK